MLRDIPEPAFLGHIGHGGGAFVQARIAFGVLIVCPDSYFVEPRIFNSPIVAHSRKGFTTGTIESQWRAKFQWAVAGILGNNANHASVLLQQLDDIDLF